MPSLTSVAARFEIPLTVIEGGVGTVNGVLVETSQNTATSTVFTDPRRILRVRQPAALEAGMVVRSPVGEIFIVGNNGASELPEGDLWQSYRLFRATKKVLWQRRGKTVDPVTLLPIEGSLQDIGEVWAAIEPANREAIERRLHVTLEEATFITGAAVARDDVLDGRPVVRSDEQLGVRVGIVR